jgi:DNA-directed RNA polymerase subunit RPC12/RpoP
VLYFQDILLPFQGKPVMIQFACPRCQKVLQAEESATGNKVDCPGCGQRLQVPAPALNKTLLGTLIPESPPAPAIPVVPPVASQIREIKPEEAPPEITWQCSTCQAQLRTPAVVAGQSVTCPTCNQVTKVPFSSTSYRLGNVPAPGFDRPPSPPPRRERAMEPEYEEVVPRRRSSYERRPLRDREGEYRQASRARMATASLICALAGLGLFIFTWFIVILTAASHPRRPAAESMAVLWIIFMLVSFVLNLLGVIFGAGGMNPQNQSNRGVGIAGFVCGIVGLVLSLACGLLWWIAAAATFGMR